MRGLLSSLLLPTALERQGGAGEDTCSYMLIDTQRRLVPTIMGHIHQHSGVMSLVFSFVLLVVACVCVYSTVLFYLAAIMA